MTYTEPFPSIPEPQAPATPVAEPQTTRGKARRAEREAGRSQSVLAVDATKAIVLPLQAQTTALTTAGSGIVTSITLRARRNDKLVYVVELVDGEGKKRVIIDAVTGATIDKKSKKAVK